MNDQHSVDHENGQNIGLSHHQAKLFYGLLFAIFPLFCSAGVVMLGIQTFNSVNSEDFTRKRDEVGDSDDKLFMAALGRDVTEYCRTTYGQSAQVEYRLLCRNPNSYDGPRHKYYVWIKVQDGDKILCQGLAKVGAISKTRFQIENVVSSKALLEEPASDGMAPYYIVAKMDKMVAAAEGKRITKPSDYQIIQLLNKEKGSFEQLKSLLHGDKQLSYVSYSHINKCKLPDEPLSASLKKGAITKARYELYLALLDKIHCQSVSYGTELSTYKPLKKDEIWYQMWRPLSGEKIAKWIIYSDISPRNCVEMTNTDTFQPFGKDRIACAKISDHWYVTYGDRPDYFEKRD